jgi:hypothetical protein
MAGDEVVYSRSWKAVLKARQRNLEGTSLKTERLANAPLGDTYKRYQDLSDLDLEIEELVEFVKKNSLGRSNNSAAQARRLRANHPQQTNRTEWKTKTCIVRACVEPAAPSYTCCEKCLKHHKLGPYYKSAGEVDYDGIDSTPQERTTPPQSSTEPKASIFDGSPIPRRYIWPVANPRGIKKLP